MIVPALVLLLSTVALQDDKPLLTQDELLDMMREAMPAVEKATGRKFRDPVWARLSNRADVQRALTEELIPQMKILEPTADAAQSRTLAERSALAFGEILVAKYAWKSGTLHLISATIRKMAELLEQPGLLERSVIRVIVTHELVHALDYQEYALFENFGASKTSTELDIWNALSEGHAQHVTRKVCEAIGDLASFDKYEQAILAGPPSLGEAERYLASVMTASLKLAYVDGRAFFDALEKTGRKTYVEDVFRKPPKSKVVIIKPDRYYAPPGAVAADFDPAPAFDAFAKDFGPEWSRRTQELDHSMLRASFGSFIDAKKVDEVIDGMLEGRVFVLNPKNAPQDKIVAVALIQLRDAEAAKKMAEASIELSKAKDKKLAEGRIRITKAEYATAPLKEGGSFMRIRKSMSIQEQTIEVGSAVGAVGEFEFELILSNEEADDARVTAMIEALLGGLRKK